MNEAQRTKLWSDYARTKSPEIREQLILEYAPLVKLVAGRLSMYLGYNVEYEDLCSYGIFGLIDAIDKFDSLKDVKFETYASLRIRGSILDQIRKMDWIPRTIRQKQKKIEQVMKEVECTKGRPATDDEIAQGLGITSEDYVEWQSQMKITGIVHLMNSWIRGPKYRTSRPLSIDLMHRKKLLIRRNLTKNLKKL